jgi:hypothetical protein
MIVIKNEKKYYPYVIRVTLLLLTGLIIFHLVKTPPLWGTVLFFLILELIFISNTFTQSISIDASRVVISYFSFLIEKQLTIPISKTEFKITKTASFRSPTYFLLSVFENEKRVYQIDTRDGFSEEDFHKLQDFRNNTSD